MPGEVLGFSRDDCDQQMPMVLSYFPRGPPSLRVARFFKVQQKGNEPFHLGALKILSPPIYLLEKLRGCIFYAAVTNYYKLGVYTAQIYYVIVHEVRSSTQV